VPNHHAIETARNDIVRLCHTGLDSPTLRRKAIRRLRHVLPVDSFWFATADPATLLFTGSLVDSIPEKATPLFIANEFLQNDVNKWTQLAEARLPINSLYLATNGSPGNSPRYRDICLPLGFGDELRAALRTGKVCWGFMCLHRERNGSRFTGAEISILAGLAPHIAQGLRAALLLERAKHSDGTKGPGLLLLAADLSLTAANEAGQYWLSEIRDMPSRKELPQAVYATVARLAALERGGHISELAPRGRIQSRSGQWLVIHASRLSGRTAPGDTAVILEPAQPAEIAPLLLHAYGLTQREAELAQLVLRGMDTAQISNTLAISDLTVQQHLKSIFDKTGASNRRELTAQFFCDYKRANRSLGALKRHV
jgi:DNA-binding CsgD family transcriptional regulator